MKIATVSITGVSPISFSRKHNTPYLNREGDDAYNNRTWREKLHCNSKGEVLVEAIMIKNTLNNVAAFLAEKIHGRGQQTYSKHFRSGLLVLEDMPLVGSDGKAILKKDVDSITLSVSSTGTPGGGKRVDRTFPIIHEWSGVSVITIFDEIITEDVLKRHLEFAGKFIGFGRFRPQNGGTNGRFLSELRSFTAMLAEAA
jgi:hypothetical protein